MDFTRTEAGLLQRDIGEHSYEFAKWGAEEALSTLLDIGTIIGKPLGAAADKLDMDALKDRRLELPMDVLGVIVEQFAAEMGQHKAVAMGVIKRLATKGVLCDGKPVQFDLHYKDRLPHMFDVLAAAMEVQYGGFFGGAFAGLRLRPVVPTPPPASQPQASTPSSGVPY